MGLFSGLFRSRDKPQNSYDSPSYTYFFGRTYAKKRVDDRTALQQIAVYACVATDFLTVSTATGDILPKTSRIFWGIWCRTE